MEKGSEGWTEGKFNANSTAGAPGRTVGQLYGGQKVWLTPSMPSLCSVWGAYSVCVCVCVYFYPPRCASVSCVYVCSQDVMLIFCICDFAVPIPKKYITVLYLLLLILTQCTLLILINYTLSHLISSYIWSQPGSGVHPLQRPETQSGSRAWELWKKQGPH